MTRVVVDSDLVSFKCLDCGWFYRLPLDMSAGVPCLMYSAILREVEQLHSCNKDNEKDNESE